jgi:type II secretory ATPase GspE/PulE/Tfp pilus assembly ATPase PilB-like protein
MGPDAFISTSSNDREAVTLLNDLFLEAARQGVSDIHFQEQDGECRVRYR